MDRFVGKRIDGRYEIQEIIGVGGMAVVYKARDNHEDRTVAVKILKSEFTSNEEFLRRFKNESKAIAMLSHPNIVNVYDVSFGDLIQYIVMEYIEGITLKEYIEQEGSLRWKDAVHFTVQILKGLQHAHDKGIVHRDVKPQNIMVLPDGTIKVTDFGIARFARSDQRTITDKAIGSVHYISPEQARGEKTDEKADVYSVGVMLYEMITGKLPFQADSAVSVAIMQLQRDPQLPSEINGSIPLGLEQITMHAMQKMPERRYQSAAEMLCDLVQFRKDPSLTFEYSYFVDNSPTKYVNDISEEEFSSSSDSKYTEEEEVKEKSTIIPILAGIATTLVIALITLGIIFIPKLFSNTGEEIACPNFVGLKFEEVDSNKEYNEQFDLKYTYGYSDEYEAGIIYKQSEKAKKMLKKDAPITLYVSQGKVTKKVPNVYGMKMTMAEKELENNGFTVVIKEVEDDKTEKGLVIKTTPAAGEPVAEGSKITVFVSSGQTAEIPDVTKMTKEAAKKTLEKEGFTVSIEEIYADTSKKQSLNCVTKQEPEASAEKVPEGTAVKIYVCVGYQFDINVDFNNAALENLKSGTYKITLWEGGKEVAGVGGNIDVSQLTKYTFKGIKTTAEENSYRIKIDNYVLCDVEVNIGTSAPSFNYSQADFPVEEQGGEDEE